MNFVFIYLDVLNDIFHNQNFTAMRKLLFFVILLLVKSITYSQQIVESTNTTISPQAAKELANNSFNYEFVEFPIDKLTKAITQKKNTVKIKLGKQIDDVWTIEENELRYDYLSIKKWDEAGNRLPNKPVCETYSAKSKNQNINIRFAINSNNEFSGFVHDIKTDIMIRFKSISLITDFKTCAIVYNATNPTPNTLMCPFIKTGDDSGEGGRTMYFSTAYLNSINSKLSSNGSCIVSAVSPVWGQAYYNGVAINSTPFFVNTRNGTITINISNSTPFSDPSFAATVNPTSVYIGPTQNVLTVDFTVDKESANIQDFLPESVVLLTDKSKELKRNEPKKNYLNKVVIDANKFEWDLSGLDNGTYFVHINYGSGMIFKEKILVQK